MTTKLDAGDSFLGVCQISLLITLFSEGERIYNGHSGTRHAH